jgi:hypothetical protein
MIPADNPLKDCTGNSYREMGEGERGKLELTQEQNLVRKEGFEPPRPFGHKILSLARLPVPPLPQWYQ